MAGIVIVSSKNHNSLALCKVKCLNILKLATIVAACLVRKTCNNKTAISEPMLYLFHAKENYVDLAGDSATEDMQTFWPLKRLPKAPLTS